MKYLKIILLGLITFAAPIVFYTQALQQEKEKDKGNEIRKNADSNYLALYKAYIRDSIALSIIINQDTQKQVYETPNPNESDKKIIDLLNDIKDSVESKNKNGNAEDNSDIDSILIEKISKSDSLLESLLDRIKTESNPFPNTYYYDQIVSVGINAESQSETIYINKREFINDYQYICIHAYVGNQIQKGEYYFTFPDREKEELNIFYCSNSRHTDKNGKKVDKRDIPYLFHSKISDETDPNHTYAIYFPFIKNSTEKQINLNLYSSKFNRTSKVITIKFQ